MVTDLARGKHKGKGDTYQGVPINEFPDIYSDIKLALFDVWQRHDNVKLALFGQLVEMAIPNFLDEIAAEGE